MEEEMTDSAMDDMNMSLQRKLENSMLPDQDQNLSEVLREVESSLSEETRLALKEAGNIPRPVCGTVWGGGEIAYRCKTCEKDPTCAVCATCFENGDHEGHDYFMICTGGGCCDCGDPEAWKEEGFCKHHRATSNAEPHIEDKVRDDVSRIITLVVNYWTNEISKFNHRRLEKEKIDEDVEKASMPRQISAEILEWLNDFIAGSMHATIITGRAAMKANLLHIIMDEGYSQIFNAKDVIQQKDAFLYALITCPSLRLEVAKIYLLNYPQQVKAIETGPDCVVKVAEEFLFKFSVQIFTVNPVVTHLTQENHLLEILLSTIAVSVLETTSQFKNTHLASTNQTDTNVHRGLLKPFDDLILCLRHDAALAACFDNFLDHIISLISELTGLNPLLQQEGDHILYEPHLWELTFSLEGSAIEVGELLIKEAKRRGDVGMKKLLSVLEKSALEYGHYIFSVLQKPVQSSDSHQVPGNSANTYSMMITSLRRLPEKHTTIMFLLSWVESKLPKAENQPSIDQTVTSTPVSELRSVLLGNASNFKGVPTSFHLPVHRLLTLFVSEYPQLLLSENDVQKRLLLLVLPILRVFLTCAESSAGLWVRNGEQFAFIRDQYHMFPWAARAMHLDLIILRYSAAYLPKGFLVEVLMKATLLGSFIEDSMNAQGQTSLEDLSTSHLVNEYICRLIITIHVERFGCGWDSKREIETHLIHKLATGHHTFSELLGSLPPDAVDNHMSGVHAVLQEHADYRSPTPHEPGRYSLKKSSWNRVFLFFFQWDKKGIQLVEENFRRVFNTSAIEKLLPENIRSEEGSGELASLPACLYHVNDSGISIQSYLEAVTKHGTHWNELSVALHLCLLQLGSNPEGAKGNTMRLARNLERLESDNELQGVVKVIKMRLSELERSSDSNGSEAIASSSSDELKRKREEAKRKARMNALASIQSAQNTFSKDLTEYQDSSDEDMEMDVRQNVPEKKSCCYCFAERSDDEMCLFSHMEVTHVIKQTNKPSSAAPDPSSFPSVLRQNDNDIKLVSSILGADDRDTSPPIWYRNSDANEDNTSHIRIREDELPGVIISSCGHAAHRGCIQRHQKTNENIEIRGTTFSYGEISCPVCRSPVNCCVPLGPQEQTQQREGLDTCRTGDASEPDASELSGFQFWEDLSLEAQSIALDALHHLGARPQTIEDLPSYVDESCHSFNTYATYEQTRPSRMELRLAPRKKGAIIWHDHANNNNKDSNSTTEEESQNTRKLAAFFESSLYSSSPPQRSERGQCEAYFEYWYPKTYDTVNSEGQYDRMRPLEELGHKVLTITMGLVSDSESTYCKDIAFKVLSNVFGQATAFDALLNCLCTTVRVVEIASRTQETRSALSSLLSSETMLPQMRVVRSLVGTVRHAIKEFTSAKFCALKAFKSIWGGKSNQGGSSNLVRGDLATLFLRVCFSCDTEDSKFRALVAFFCRLNCDRTAALIIKTIKRDGLDSKSISNDTVIEVMVNQALPFLRIAVILGNLFGVNISSPPPSSLSSALNSHQVTISDGDKQSMQPLHVLDAMTSSLGLPSMLPLFQHYAALINPEENTVSNSASIFYRTSKLALRCLGEEAASIPRDPAMMCFKLTNLPDNMYDVITISRDLRCKACNKTPKVAALCLLCGELMPTLSSCCSSRKKQCFEHARHCGYGICPFMVIRDSRIILLRGTTVTIWSSLYLDEHGEEDVLLNRGRPMILNPERTAAMEEVLREALTSRRSILKPLPERRISDF